MLQIHETSNKWRYDQVGQNFVFDETKWKLYSKNSPFQDPRVTTELIMMEEEGLNQGIPAITVSQV